MTSKEQADILDYLSKMDPEYLDTKDMLTIAAAQLAFLETIAPIVRKCMIKDENATFLFKM